MLSIFASHSTGPVTSEAIVNNEIAGFWIGLALMGLFGYWTIRAIMKRCFNGNES